jgi:hypothetical protein
LTAPSYARVQVLSDRAVYAEMVEDLARQIAAVRLADMSQARALPLRGGERVALGASGSWASGSWASGSWGEWLLGRPALQEEKERGEKRAAARQRAPSRALSHARVAGMRQVEEFTAEVERRLSLLSDENQARLPRCTRPRQRRPRCLHLSWRAGPARRKWPRR